MPLLVPAHTCLGFPKPWLWGSIPASLRTAPTLAGALLSPSPLSRQHRKQGSPGLGVLRAGSAGGCRHGHTQWPRGDGDDYLPYVGEEGAGGHPNRPGLWVFPAPPDLSPPSAPPRMHVEESCALSVPAVSFRGVCSVPSDRDSPLLFLGTRRLPPMNTSGQGSAGVGGTRPQPNGAVPTGGRAGIPSCFPGLLCHRGRLAVWSFGRCAPLWAPPSRMTHRVPAEKQAQGGGRGVGGEGPAVLAATPAATHICNCGRRHQGGPLGK